MLKRKWRRERVGLWEIGLRCPSLSCNPAVVSRTWNPSWHAIIVSSVGAVRFSNSKASWCLGRITQVFPDKVSWIFRLREKLQKTCVCVWTMNSIDMFTSMLYIYQNLFPSFHPKNGPKPLMYFVSCFMTSISPGQGRLPTAWIIWRRLDGKRVPWIAYWRLQMMRERPEPSFCPCLFVDVARFQDKTFLS